MADDPGSAAAATVRVGDQFVMTVAGLELLIARLAQLGYEVKGPVVRGGAVVPGIVASAAELPVGKRDEQSPGQYRLRDSGDGKFFSWAVGPGSWKAEFFPPVQEVWRARRDGDLLHFRETSAGPAPLAIVGARPCEIAAMEVQDKVLKDGAHRDPVYGDRREGAFIVVVECGFPASTCFCASMGTGPGIERGFDLALTEIDDADGHRFLGRVGTESACTALAGITYGPVSDADVEARVQVLEESSHRISRALDTDGLADVLVRNLDHPRWAEVAERCLSCANCTMVCPTCFCSDIRDVSDLAGGLERRRLWSSCFDLDHSYLHGGAVRQSVSSRYRQWMTHKLSTWWDQFDTSGCVGCGRCIAWCPVGIDITEEASVIAASDGAAATSDETKGGVA